MLLLDSAVRLILVDVLFVLAVAEVELGARGPAPGVRRGVEGAATLGEQREGLVDRVFADRQFRVGAAEK